ncbi:MAG: Uma2 family endonuclease [Gemmataceae bacterium]
MIAEPRKFTAAQYLAIDRKAALKSELLDSEMFAMAKANRFHAAVTDNLVCQLREQLKNEPCRISSGDLRVKVPAIVLYTYPDIVIVWGQAEFEDDVLDTLLNPRIIIEILSDASAKFDRGLKCRYYQKIEALQEYVIVWHSEPAVERYGRQPQGDWICTSMAGLDAVLALVTVPVTIPLADIYAGFAFPESPRR